MQTTNTNPYEHCPTYETGQFTLRLIREEDAPDLLACYADPAAAPIFNSDNCTSSFIYHTLEEMTNCVRFWVDSYRWQYFVRFSVVDKAKGKAVGTIEFFAKPGTFDGAGRVGVLRLDLASPYEQEGMIAEILQVVEEHFYGLFAVDSVITKAVPQAAERIRALRGLGFQPVPDKAIVPYDHYYLRTRGER